MGSYSDNKFFNRVSDRADRELAELVGQIKEYPNEFIGITAEVTFGCVVLTFDFFGVEHEVEILTDPDSQPPDEEDIFHDLTYLEVD